MSLWKLCYSDHFPAFRTKSCQIVTHDSCEMIVIPIPAIPDDSIFPPHCFLPLQQSLSEPLTRLRTVLGARMGSVRCMLLRTIECMIECVKNSLSQPMRSDGLLNCRIADACMGEVMAPTEQLVVRSLYILTNPRINSAFPLRQNSLEAGVNSVIKSLRIPVQIANRDPAIEFCKIVCSKGSEGDVMVRSVRDKGLFNAAFVRSCDRDDK